MGETAISSASSSQHASTHRQPARPLCLLRRKPPRQHRQGARGAEYRKAEDDERNYQRNHEWIPSHPRPSMLHLRISPGRASINESLGAQLPLPAVSQAGGRRPASLREGRVPDRTRLACDAARTYLQAAPAEQGAEQEATAQRGFARSADIARPVSLCSGNTGGEIGGAPPPPSTCGCASSSTTPAPQQQGSEHTP